MRMMQLLQSGASAVRRISFHPRLWATALIVGGVTFFILRKLHLVRPDLLPYPLEVRIYA